MASLSIAENPAVVSAGFDLVKPIRIWMDGAFDMMHYGPFLSLLISQDVFLITQSVVEWMCLFALVSLLFITY